MIRQCELRSGNNVAVTWLPERVAFIGSVVYIRDDDRPWTVKAAYEKIEEDKLLRRFHKVSK